MSDEILPSGQSSTPPLPPPPPPILPSANTPTPQHHKTSEHFAPIRIHFAINKDDIGRVKELIATGLDLNFVALGNTPLTLSILRSSFDIARLLVDALSPSDLLIPESAPWRRQPIHLAVRGGSLELVKYIVARCPATVHATDAMLFTPLHWAAAGNFVDIADHLIAAGAHINVADDRGRSPLHRAIEQDHMNIARTLLNAGAAIEARDHVGWTPLYQATVCGMTTMVQMLLNAGANPNSRNNSAQTVLHGACGRTAKPHIRLLAQTGIDFYTRQLVTGGYTVKRALTATTSDVSQVKLLLDYGAEVNARDVQGRTPLQTAAEFGHDDIIRVLFDAGADFRLESRWVARPDWPPRAIANNAVLCEWLREAFGGKIRPLSDLCKFRVRSSLGRKICEKVERLPLPHALQIFCALVNEM